MFFLVFIVTTIFIGLWFFLIQGFGFVSGLSELIVRVKLSSLQMLFPSLFLVFFTLSLSLSIYIYMCIYICIYIYIYIYIYSDMVVLAHMKTVLVKFLVPSCT